MPATPAPARPTPRPSSRVDRRRASRRARRPARPAGRRCLGADAEAGRGRCCASSSCSITSSSSSSSEVIRRSSETSSCCIRSRSLGLVICPWSIRSRSRLRRVLTCSTSRSTLFCSTVEVVDDDPRVAHLVVEVGAARPPACGDLGDARAGGARWWRSWSARESSSWTSRSFELGGGIGFQGCSCDQVRNCQGSVHGVLTRVSTVSPSAAGAARSLHHRQPGPLGRPVRDVDQRRPVVLEELARRGGAAGRW